MSKELQPFNNLGMSRQSQKLAAEKLVEMCMDGEIDPLKLKAHITAMKNTIKDIETNEEFTDIVLDRAERYGSKSFRDFGALYQIKEAGVQFDFTACNDPIYNRLKSEFENLRLLMKEREEYLKHIPSRGENIIDDETGECVTIYPPVKRSTTTVSVTLK